MLNIKHYALLILSGLVAALAFLLQFVGARSKRLKYEAEAFKAKAHHAKTVMEKDKEIDLEYDKRTKELADDVEKNGTSDELRDPNKW